MARSTSVASYPTAVKFLIAVVIFACGREAKHEEPTPATATPAVEAQPPAHIAVEATRRDVRAITDEVDAIGKQLDELDSRVTTVGDNYVNTAANESERVAARAKLTSATTDRAQLAARIAKLSDQATHAAHVDVATAGLSVEDKNALDLAIITASDIRDKAEFFAKRSDELATRIAGLETTLRDKQVDADRAAAQSKLDELRREQKAAKAHK
jgi:hypothetical protein